MSRLKYLQNKIVPVEQAKHIINGWKLKGQKIVFTNGCFDILHQGHVVYLAKAAELGNKLVVAINTDASVKAQQKSPERPVNNEYARSIVLSALGFVDLVLLFSETTPLHLIEELAPDILVKGADYNPEITDSSHKQYIVGSDIVRKNGGSVEVIALEEGFSTTSIIQKLRS